MINYLDLLTNVLSAPTRNDRTKTGTRSLFGARLEYDLQEYFPLLPYKFTNFNAVKEELRWFLSGSTNINDLGSKIWDEWADPEGELGPIYGSVWRGNTPHQPVDQIRQLLVNLENDPYSRRHVVSSWIPEILPKGYYSPQTNATEGYQALAPCHVMFQCYVREDAHTKLKYLDMQMYQRSADIFLGVPFNIASYALLNHLIARHLDILPGKYIHVFGDVHLYSNHLSQACEMLENDHNFKQLDATKVRLRFDLSAPRHLQLGSQKPFDPMQVNVVSYPGNAPKIPAPVAV